MWKRNDGSAIEQQDSDPWTKPVRTNEPSEFEQVSHEEIEDQLCKDTDPLIRFYNKAYKNRWKQIKLDINAVGFTPIAKRCAYPGAPCEWQKKVEGGNQGTYELLAGMKTE